MFDLSVNMICYYTCQHVNFDIIFHSQPENKQQILNHDTSGELHKCRKTISRLENEKDSLLLQVSVLTDQVEVQGEKMRELEFLRDELQIKLTDLEETVKEVFISSP